MSTPDFNKPDHQAASSVPQQPSFDSSQQPSYAPAPASQENNTLSIVGIVLAVLFPFIGLIVSGIAWYQAKNEGRSIKLARIGVIIGAVLLVLNVIFLSTIGAGAMSSFLR